MWIISGKSSRIAGSRNRYPGALFADHMRVGRRPPPLPPTIARYSAHAPPLPDPSPLSDNGPRAAWAQLRLRKTWPFPPSASTRSRYAFISTNAHQERRAVDAEFGSQCTLVEQRVRCEPTHTGDGRGKSRTLDPPFRQACPGPFGYQLAHSIERGLRTCEDQLAGGSWRCKVSRPIPGEEPRRSPDRQDPGP